jgi:NDP-sugar pyrophosphorylase family protein
MSLPVAILVGGLATRLRPLTEKIPKALIEVNDQPFLAHQLRLLASSGITDIVICAWYQAEKIRDFARDGKQFGLNIKYSFDGDQPLGTGGALKKALPLLGEAFFILYGDSFLPCDYQSVEMAFTTCHKDGLMTVYRNRDLGDKSNVNFEKGKILAYDKLNRSAKMDYIDYGLGVIKASVLAGYPAHETFDLAQVYQNLLSQSQLAGYEVKTRFYEVGSFSGIKELEEYLKKKEGKNNDRIH